MAPGARNKFGAPCSNPRSFGSKCTALKKVLATLLGLFGALRSHLASPAVIRRPHSDCRPGNCALLAPFSLRPCSRKALDGLCRSMELTNKSLYFCSEVCVRAGNVKSIFRGYWTTPKMVYDVTTPCHSLQYLYISV